MKLFFYDLETTGTDSEKCAIHQFSGKISIDGKIKETFDFHMRPFEGAEINEEALKVANITEEELMSYPSSEEVYKEVCLMLAKYVNPYDKNVDEKFVTVGYNNARFDDDFLFNFFLRYHEVSPDKKKYKQGFYKSNFFNKKATIDVLRLAQPILLAMGLSPENYKLGTIAELLDCMPLTEGALHNSDYDIDATINIFKKLIKRIDFKTPLN